MPCYALLDSRPQCRWPDVIFHSSIRPVGLPPVFAGTSEDVIPVLIVGSHLAPVREHIGKSFVHRHRLPACFCFHFSYVLTHDSTAETNLTRRKICVDPLQSQQFAHSEPCCDCHVDGGAPRLHEFSKQIT